MMRNIFFFLALLVPFAARAGNDLQINGALIQQVAGENALLSDIENTPPFTDGAMHQSWMKRIVKVPFGTFGLWNNYDNLIINVPGGDQTCCNGGAVSRYTETVKYSDSPNAPLWAGVDSVVDFTGHKSSVAGPIISREFDLEASGPDDQTSFGSSRMNLTIAASRGRNYTGVDTTFARAINVWTNPAQANYIRDINIGGGWNEAAIQTTDGTQQPGAVTIKMAPGQILSLAGQGAGGIGNVQYNPTSLGSGAIVLYGQVQADQNLLANGWIRPGTVTVAQLPACNINLFGRMFIVTDAKNPVWNTPLVGGGPLNSILAVCNGSQWMAH